MGVMKVYEVTCDRCGNVDFFHDMPTARRKIIFKKEAYGKTRELTFCDKECLRLHDQYSVDGPDQRERSLG